MSILSFKLPIFAALFTIAALLVAAAEEVNVDLHLAPGQLQAVPSFSACSYYFRPTAAMRGPYVVEYRRGGEARWRRGFEPVSDLPAGIWKGSLFDLPEDTPGEVRVLDQRGVQRIAPVAFRTWTSHPPIAKVIDLSTIPGADKGIVITEQGTPDGWIKYTAPHGWRLERPNEPSDSQAGAISLRRARYVILENLTIVGGERFGIHLDHCDSVRILNCDISGWGRVGRQQYTNDGSRGKYRDVHGELINYDAGVKIDESARTVVERCYVHDPRGRANSWQYSHPAGPCAVHVNNTLGGTVLRWNDFIGSDEHRFNDVIESSNNGAVNGGFNRDSDITGNFLAFGNDDGVELEGGGMNVRFYRNKVEGTTCGVSTGACRLGPQFIYDNLVANEGDETGLALMLFKNSYGRPQSGKRHFINNTLVTVSSAPYGNYGKVAGSERLGYMRNNVFVSSSARLPGEVSRRDDFDGDLFWTDRSEASSQAYLAGMHEIGQEPHGIAANPDLMAPVEGDFHLSPQSPGRARGLPVDGIEPAGVNLGAFPDAATEVPYRPMALTAVPRQLDFMAPDHIASLQVRVQLPASAPNPVAFEIRQNQVFTWFKVSPTAATVRPGETVTLNVTVDPAVLRGRPLFKGAFLVRTDSGLSRPVTVYAASRFQVDLRPAMAPGTAYIEAAALPELAADVRTTSASGVFGGRYVELGPRSAPEIRSNFEVSKAGRYCVLVRAAIARGVMNTRHFQVRIDRSQPVEFKLTPDYEWNTDNDRFRAVYIAALGELQRGKHELRMNVQGGLKLNEIIVTTNPEPFFADGWQKQVPHGAAAGKIYDGTKGENDIDSAADVTRLVDATFGPRRPPMDLEKIRREWTAIVEAATRPRVKVIFDTDIGTDIDDAITLLFALSRPELDVLAVTTSRGQVGQRAAIVSRLLQVMDRTDIPFAPGSPRLIDGRVLRDKPVDQFPFAGPASDRPKPATDDAQVLFRRVIEAHPGQVWLVVTGPMTNAAILIRNHPDIAAKLKGIVCMGGEPTRATVETNIGNDPVAADVVCRSGLLKFVGTDDVTRAMLMPKPDIDRLARLDTPVARALLQLRELWSPQRGKKPGPVVFDVCPMMWLFAPDLFTTTHEGLTVDARGVMRITPGVPLSGVATGMQVVAAHRLLMDTLVHAHPGHLRDVFPN